MKMPSWLTQENITFVIAICGSVLSVYNFIHAYIQNKMKLKVTYKNHNISYLDDNGLTVSLSIENVRNCSISISRIFITINNTSSEFFWIPQFVYRATQSSKLNGVFDEINIHTVALPAQIEGNGIIGGFFYTDFPVNLKQLDLPNANTFITIHSQKGIKKYNICMNNTTLEY